MDVLCSRMVALGAVLLAGCGSFNATKKQLLTRAAFDLNCPKTSLQVADIDKRTKGIKGCGQRATYVEQCKPCANGYVGCECTWALNADGRRMASTEPESIESSLRAASSVTLERADWVTTWSEYVMKESSTGFYYFSPAPNAEPLVMTKTDYDEWRKRRGDMSNNFSATVRMRPPMITEAGQRVPVEIRTIARFRVPDKTVQNIRLSGTSAKAYWAIDHSQRNPANRGKAVDPVSELYVVGLSTGTALIELILTDGSTRRVELAVGPK